MTAFVVAQVRPRDPEKMSAYAAAAVETLKPYGGEILHRGEFQSALLGEADPHGFGVMRFPDAQSAKDWFASAEYQSVAPLREAAADMSFVLYEAIG